MNGQSGLALKRNLDALNIEFAKRTQRIRQQEMDIQKALEEEVPDDGEVEENYRELEQKMNAILAK